MQKRAQVLTWRCGKLIKGPMMVSSAAHVLWSGVTACLYLHGASWWLFLACLVLIPTNMVRRSLRNPSATEV